jgi:hypothetical protein
MRLNAVPPTRVRRDVSTLEIASYWFPACVPLLQPCGRRISLETKAPLWMIASSLLLNLVLLMAVRGLLPPEASMRLNEVSRASIQDTGTAQLLIIARTHARETPTIISAFLSSLRAQSYENFQVWLINGECPGKAVHSEVVDILSDNRFSVMSFGNDAEPLEDSSYGYYTSDLAVRELLRRNDAGISNFKYLLITNADNLYHHKFLDTVTRKFATHPSPPCIVATDWVSRYFARLKSGKLGNRNTLRHVEFGLFHIDLGTAVVEIASLRRAFRGKSEFFEKNETTADWTYFERILGPSKHCGVAIREVLFVHQ